MEVSHVNDHVTHAVIGGKQSIDFGISNSAEFFNILSSTLYKDQILAVVRETLCNAWDAHIEAGCMHTPVQLTLTDNKLIIRDFGSGIHHDDMGIVYGTYGNSTKKNDGRQTGGFGLGCKAPFAYTDHFEVISNHGGVKTIYNLSKSSGEVMGKPGMIPIASFPTTDSGMQISIDIKNTTDYSRFKTLITRIVRNGDMNMSLNGTVLGKLEFDIKKSNYLILTDLEFSDNKILIRYGNVLYPVDSVDEIANQYSRIIAHLKQLGKHSNYSIIFQAPPHSISVQPSREGLSMQAHTVNTLKGLFAGFLKTVDEGFDAACSTLAKTSIAAAVKETMIKELLHPKKELPIKVTKHHNRISDLEAMASEYLQHSYPSSLAFRQQDVATRLNAMAAAGLLQRGLVQSYIKEMQGITERDYSRSYNVSNTWAHRHIFAPLMTKMLKNNIDHKKLYVWNYIDRHAYMYGGYSAVLSPVATAVPYGLFEALPFLRNIVVISPSRKKTLENMHRHTVLKELGDYPGFMFYHTGTKKEDKEKAVAFFAATNMVVVDLTLPQPWDEVTQIISSTPRKPKKIGVQQLSCVRYSNGIDLNQLTQDTAPRIEEPEFILNVSLRKQNNLSEFPSWDDVSSRKIVDLFGTKGAITNSTTVADKYMQKGVKDLDDYVLEKLIEFVANNANAKQYWEYCPNRALKTVDSYFLRYTKRLFCQLYDTPELRQQFGLINNLTEEERKYVSLCSYVTESRYHHNAASKKIVDEIEKIPLAPINSVLLGKFQGNELLYLVNADALASHLRVNYTGVKAAKALQLLLHILN